MPTFRGKNLRSGDLAETLGITLLQGVALVAPVPRTEDVGIDAIVTLLRSFDAKRLIAEDSLYVQLKSSTVTSIEYQGEEVKWLYALDLPIFFALVDRKASRVSLFCAQQIAEAFVSNPDRSSLIVHFDGTPNCLDIVSRHENEVHIGPPVMVWDITQCGSDNENIRDLFYKIVKKHVELQKENLQHRSVGWVANYTWKTNEVPSGGLFKTMRSKTSKEALDEAYDKMMPYFFVWHCELLASSDWDAARDVVSLLEKAKLLIEAQASK